MAINLWKIGGQPTSYNPLPQGYTVYVYVKPFQEYVLKIKTKSLSGASIRAQIGNGSTYGETKTLTSEFKEYTFDIKVNGIPNAWALYLYTGSTANDIIIEDIQLVQKPLPTLTINGISGFNNPNWGFSSFYKVIDDETVELNATAGYQFAYLLVDVQPNTNYVYSVDHNANIGVYSEDGSVAIVSTTPLKTITFNSGQRSKIRCMLNNGSLGVGKFTFKRPMLNLGSTPAPFAKKTGEKMVLPSVKGRNYTPSFNNWNKDRTDVASYTNDEIIWTTNAGFNPTSVNIQPLEAGKSYTFSFDLIGGQTTISLRSDQTTQIAAGVLCVEGRNIITFTSPTNLKQIVIRQDSSNNSNQKKIKNPMLQEGTATPYEPYAVQVNKKPKKYVPKKNLFDKNTANKGYSLNGSGVSVANPTFAYSDYIPVKPNTVYSKTVTNGGEFYTVNKSFITAIPTGTLDLITPSNAYFLRVNIPLDSLNAYQLEEGTTPTPYEPYTEILPRVKRGLAFNGVSDYLQLPSMTMDSIEIDCLIDSNTSSDQNTLFQSYNGTYYGRVANANQGSTPFPAVNGILSTSPHPRNIRVKIRYSFTQYMGETKVMSNFAGTNNVKGTLYKVTCYLAGKVVAEYDFENPSNFIGDKVLPNAKNLIPNFEDSRWNLHANFKVLGKDVGRLDGTADYQWSTVLIDVKPNTIYWLVFGRTSTEGARMEIRNPSGTVFLKNAGQQPPIYVTGPNETQLLVRISNLLERGTFDFVKPQLYELSGKEGTLVGKPTPLRKAAKRTLYSKR